MSTVRRITVIVGLSLSMILGSHAGEVIDVENGFPALGGPIHEISLSFWHAQTFKPNLPYLTAVEFGGFGTDVPTFTQMADGSTITVQIFETSGGMAVGAPLATMSRQTPLNDGFEQFMGRYVLPEPLDVSAYTNSASLWMQWSTTDAGYWGIESTRFQGDVYADGAEWLSDNQGVSFALIGDQDMVFRTWGVADLNDTLAVVDVTVGDAVAHEFQSESGINYLLEFNTNQVTETWEPTGFSVVGDGGVMRMYDATGFDSNKTYRSRADE